MIPYIFVAFASFLGLAAYRQPRQSDQQECDQETSCDEHCEQSCSSDSLDEHLDILTKKVAEKESKIKVSNSKIRQKKNEITNLSAVSIDVKEQYKKVMNGLKKDIERNEKDSKLLQAQIEWISRRRAELKDEVLCGQNMYKQAVTGLAKGLSDIQKSARPIPPSLIESQSTKYCSFNPSLRENCVVYKGQNDGKQKASGMCPVENKISSGSIRKKKSSGSIRFKRKSKSKFPCDPCSSRDVESVGTSPKAPSYFC